MKRKPNGFTLLESLFTMAVLLIALVAIFALFQTGLMNLTTGVLRMQVAVLASNLFEEMKSFGVSNLPASGTIANLVQNHPGRITAFPSPFEGDVTVTSVSEDLDGDGTNDYVDKAGNSTLKEILLRVRAPGAKLKEVSFRLRLSA